MPHIFYKLTQKEAQDICRKVGVILPTRKKKIPAKNGHPAGFFEVQRRYLNEARTIWIQPCHYYRGIQKQFSHEITHSTTESAFSRFMNKYRVPARGFTY